MLSNCLCLICEKGRNQVDLQGAILEGFCQSDSEAKYVVSALSNGVGASRTLLQSKLFVVALNKVSNWCA